MLSHLKLARDIQLFSDPSADPQASLSMGFPREEYWRGLSFSSPGDLPNPGIKPTSSVSTCIGRQFFTTEPPGKPPYICVHINICVYINILHIYVYIYISPIGSFSGEPWLITTLEKLTWKMMLRVWHWHVHTAIFKIKCLPWKNKRCWI